MMVSNNDWKETINPIWLLAVAPGIELKKPQASHNYICNQQHNNFYRFSFGKTGGKEERKSRVAPALVVPPQAYITSQHLLLLSMAKKTITWCFASSTIGSM